MGEKKNMVFSIKREKKKKKRVGRKKDREGRHLVSYRGVKEPWPRRSGKGKICFATRRTRQGRREAWYHMGVSYFWGGIRALDDGRKKHSIRAEGSWRGGVLRLRFGKWCLWEEERAFHGQKKEGGAV